MKVYVIEDGDSWFSEKFQHWSGFVFSSKEKAIEYLENTHKDYCKSIKNNYKDNPNKTLIQFIKSLVEDGYLGYRDVRYLITEVEVQ